MKTRRKSVFRVAGQGECDMAFISDKRSARNGASEYEKLACVAAICALASLPLAFCAALTIWGA